MKIVPIEITSGGSGVELSNLSAGLSIRMADPVTAMKADLRYAEDAVNYAKNLKSS